jgi:uncharacterized protein (TIGR02246 family)
MRQRSPVGEVRAIVPSPRNATPRPFGRAAVLVTLSAVTGTACATHPVPASMAAMRQARGDSIVRASLDTIAAGWNRGDLETYLSAYSADVVTRDTGGFVVGRAAVAEVMRRGFWRSGRPLQALHYEHLSVRTLGPAYALATGEYVLTGGGQPTRTGWFTTVWARTPEGWRCIHDA